MNFILVNYQNRYDKTKLIQYYENNNLFHKIIIKQINKFHPNSNIHIVTDVKTKDKGNLFYHYIENLEKNNYAKLNVLDLLDEPSIYLDNDIILNKPFNLPITDNSFNLFQEYKDYSKLPENMRLYKHYNTGIVQINKPDKHIAKEIRNLKDKFLIHH